MPSEQIVSGVHWIRLGRTNAYLIERPAGAVLIDSGLPVHYPALIGVLAERDLATRGALKAILLTHRHLDHAGSAAALAARTGAAVFVHRGDAEAVRGRARLSPMRGPIARALLEPLVALSDRRLFRFCPCEEAVAIEDGWSELEGLTAVHAPGHTPGHTAYLYRPDGDGPTVVFGGDAATSGRQGTVSWPSKLFSLDPAAVRRSVERLASLDPQVLCLGHGPPLVGDVRRRLARLAPG